MREKENSRFKFRAWDKENQEMHEITDEQFIAGHDFFSNERFVPLQYTGIVHRDIEKYDEGIFDKNGMEMPGRPVFEGDIVEFKSDPSFYINGQMGDRYVIEYYGAGFFMKPVSWKAKKIDAQNYIELLPPYQTANMRGHYVVIGNIYENPELLKNEQNES